MKKSEIKIAQDSNKIDSYFKLRNTLKLSFCPEVFRDRTYRLLLDLLKNTSSK